MELLAQIIEELSVLTSKRIRKEPRQIKRPKWIEDTRAPEASGETVAPSGNPFSRAIERMTGFQPRRNTEGEYTGAPPEHLKAAMP